MNNDGIDCRYSARVVSTGCGFSMTTVYLFYKDLLYGASMTTIYSTVVVVERRTFYFRASMDTTIVLYCIRSVGTFAWLRDGECEVLPFLVCASMYKIDHTLCLVFAFYSLSRVLEFPSLQCVRTVVDTALYWKILYTYVRVSIHSTSYYSTSTAPL